LYVSSKETAAAEGEAGEEQVREVEESTTEGVVTEPKEQLGGLDSVNVEPVTVMVVEPEVGPDLGEKEVMWRGERCVKERPVEK
jgi:hypothetical protein